MTKVIVEQPGYTKNWVILYYTHVLKINFLHKLQLTPHNIILLACTVERYVFFSYLTISHTKKHAAQAAGADSS